MLLALPRVAGGTPTLDRGPRRHRAAAPARRRHHRRHRRHDRRAAARRPAPPASACAGASTGATPPCGRSARLSGWTLGYVARQPGRAVRRARCSPTGRGRRRVRLHVRLRLLPAPPRPVRRLDHDDVRARAGLARPSAGDRADLPGPVLARAPAHGAGRSCPPPPATSCSPGRSSPPCSSEGRSAAPSADLTADMLAAFALGPARVLRLPLRPARLLRPPGHPTPFLLNVVENGLNIVLAVALVGPLGVPGPGLRLRGRLHGRRRRSPSSSCSAGSAALDGRARWPRTVASIVARPRRSWRPSWSSSPASSAPTGTGAVVRTVAGVAVGAVVYGVAVVVLRLEPRWPALRTRLPRPRRRRADVGSPPCSSS